MNSAGSMRSARPARRHFGEEPLDREEVRRLFWEVKLGLDGDHGRHRASRTNSEHPGLAGAVRRYCCSNGTAVMAWKKGESGNPRGPKPGSGPVQRLRRVIEQDAPEILAAMVTAAKGGDTAAAKLLLDRIVPPVKPETRQPSAPGPTDPGEILQSGFAEGRLTFEQAERLMSLAVERAKVAELGGDPGAAAAHRGNAEKPRLFGRIFALSGGNSAAR
ncbi:MAG: hypothetical protein MZV65_42070 [Chromatiales bacterium]|nr:hypothetical protein [Chromatiales bacterium]